MRYNLRSKSKTRDDATNSAQRPSGLMQGKRKRFNSMSIEEAGPDKSNCKRKRHNIVDQQDDSPFAVFTQISANMPNVWKIVMDHLSETDVANCLRVNKGLRWVIAQCLDSYSKLRHDLDNAATTRSIAKGKVQSRFQIQIKRRTSFQAFSPISSSYGTHKELSDRVCAIDDVWFHRQGQDNYTNILKFDTKSNKTVVNSSLYTGPSDCHPSFRVSPLTSAGGGWFALHDSSDNGKCMFSWVGPERAQIIPRLKYDLGLLQATKVKMSSHEKKDAPPHFLRYRLYTQFDNGRKGTDVIITLANSNGIFDKSIVLYQFDGTSSPRVLHEGSQEQARVLLVFGRTVAVHDLETGEALWKTEIRINTSKIFVTSIRLFISDTIAGFIHFSIGNSDVAANQSNMHIFDAKSGRFISKVWVPGINTETWDTTVIKDCHICIAVELYIYVIRVNGNEVIDKTFTVPIDHFAKTKQFGPYEDPKKLGTFAKLLGFVGKSNILLGTLGEPDISSPVLFTLDLDKAFRAKNKEDIDISFSLPLSSHQMDYPSFPFQKAYQPIYKTDRCKGSIDLVGVMRERESQKHKTKLIMDNCYFITEMQYSKLN